MPKKKQPARAIFASDIHLTHKPPGFRSEEPDWYETMRRQLRDLCKLQERLDVPVIIAGDIFHHWKQVPELINFAIQEMPKCYGIPGQHDLPNHSYEDIERSAYWTLVEAGILHHLEPDAPVQTDELELFGFPWGFDPEPCLSDSELIKIAVVHKYCWVGKYKYPQAPLANQLSQFKLSGYAAAVFGDNHIGWVSKNVCNCGGFFRMTKADLDRQPFVGVLMEDGSIQKHILDTSNDIYSSSSDNITTAGPIDLGGFTEGLLELRNSEELDFAKVVRRYCAENEVSPSTRTIILDTIDEECE